MQPTRVQQKMHYQHAASGDTAFYIKLALDDIIVLTVVAVAIITKNRHLKMHLYDANIACINK
jgi:hypothetical protein